MIFEEQNLKFYVNFAKKLKLLLYVQRINTFSFDFNLKNLFPVIKFSNFVDDHYKNISEKLFNYFFEKAQNNTGKKKSTLKFI